MYGGSHGLRDEGLLQSAIDLAENRYFYDPEASLAVLAAALSWGLIKNHVFVDGDQRAGLSALVVFLKLNRHQLSCEVSEVQAMTLRAAASEISEAEWTAWLERVVRPLPE